MSKLKAAEIKKPNKAGNSKAQNVIEESQVTMEAG